MSVRKTLAKVNNLTKRNVSNDEEELKEENVSSSVLGAIRSESANSIPACSKKLYSYPGIKKGSNIQLQIHCSLIECGAVTITPSKIDKDANVVITFQIPETAYNTIQKYHNERMAKKYPPVTNVPGKTGIKEKGVLKYSNNFTKTFYDEYKMFITVKCYNFKPIAICAVGGGGAGGTQIMKTATWIGRGAGGGGAGLLGIYTPTSSNQAMTGTLQITPGVGGYAATESWETATNGKPTIINWIDEQNSENTWRFNGGGYGAGEQSPQVYPQYKKRNTDTGKDQPIWGGAGANGGSGGGSTVAPNTGITKENNTNGPPGNAWWFQHEDQIANAIYPVNANPNPTLYAWPPNMGPKDGYFQYYFSPGGQVDDAGRTTPMYTTEDNKGVAETDSSAGGGGGGAGTYSWPSDTDAYNYKAQLQGTDTAEKSPSYGVGGLAIAGVGGTGGSGKLFPYNNIEYAVGGNGGDGMRPYDDQPPKQHATRGYEWTDNGGVEWIGRKFPEPHTGSGGFGGNCSVQPGEGSANNVPAGIPNYGLIGSNGANGSVVIVMPCENLEIVSSLGNTCNLTETQNYDNPCAGVGVGVEDPFP